MAAAVPLFLSLLLLSLSVGVALTTSSDPTHCDLPPALLLASQVTELARTALTADPRSEQQIGIRVEQLDGAGQQQHQRKQAGPPPLFSTPRETSEPSEALLRRLEDLEETVSRLNSTVSRLNSTVSRLSGDGRASEPAPPGTCLQLQRANGSLPDGVYQLAALDDPVYCDFSHDGGGWTLLLTAAARDGWDRLNVRLRNAAQPSLTDNYSILGRGDALKALGTGRRFAYRLEGQAQVNRRQWGGIWLAPRDYTFTPETDTQRDIALVKKFNSWTYGEPSLQKTMPWINVEEYVEGIPLLTTTLKISKNWWGTLLTDPTNADFQHSPWINAGATHSGTILYWMREEVLP